MSGESGEMGGGGEGGGVEELMKDPAAVSALSQKIAQFINASQQPPLVREGGREGGRGGEGEKE